MRPPFVLTAALLTALVGCATNEPTKTVRPWRPGSLTSFNPDAKWDIAVNRTYDQLSVEDKQQFRGYYEGLPAECEPPFPLQGLQPLILNLMAGQESAQIEGLLVALAAIDKNGDVQSVSFLQQMDPPMSKYVAAVLMREKFKPAMCNGEPLDSEFPLKVRLKVE